MLQILDTGAVFGCFALAMKNVSLPLWPMLATVVATLTMSCAMASAPVYGPFDVKVWGDFKRMVHMGDFSGKVRLGRLSPQPGSWGLGALAGAAGEVLLSDGHMLVTHGKDAQALAVAPGDTEEAALFVSAQVRQWKAVAVPANLTQAEFETFVREQASVLGLDDRNPFPFRVKGIYPKLSWHVLNGTVAHAGAGSTHMGGKMAMKRFEQTGASGQLVGFYSGEDLEGTISHPGSRFHVHFVDDGQSVAGHVDGYMVGAGAVLQLPLR